MITSVRLEGFKNFLDATLQLGPLTVIVGTNASGKSNIRDAFRFLHGMGRGYSLAEIIGEKYVEGGVLVWKGIRGGIREVAFDDSNTFGVTTVSKQKNEPRLSHYINVNVSGYRSAPRVARERMYYGGTISVFDTHGDGDPVVQDESPYIFARLSPDTQKKKFGTRVRFLESQPVISQLEDHPEGRAQFREMALSFVEMIESMRFFDLSPEAMKVPSIPGQIILGDRGENLSSVVQAICNDEDTKRAMIEWVRQLTPLDVSDFDFVPDQTGRVLLTLIESTGRRTSAYSASDGTLRFLAIIAALMGPDSAKFYFLEEIDNGIHPTRLSLLLQLIEQQTRHRGIQVVTTTHSPQLLAMLSPEARQHASLVYRLEGSTEAKITRIVDIPGANEVLETQNLGRLHESGWLENAVQFAHVAETP